MISRARHRRYSSFSRHSTSSASTTEMRSLCSEIDAQIITEPADIIRNAYGSRRVTAQRCCKRFTSTVLPYTKRNARLSLLAISPNRMVSLRPSAFCCNMVTKPKRKCFSIHFAGCHLARQCFPVLRLTPESRNALRSRKTFHGRMTGALLAVDEWMVLNKRIAKHGRLVHNRWVQLCAPKRHARLSQRRFQSG